MANGYVKTSFFIREDLLQKVRDCAYTDRVKNQDVIGRALEEYLKDRTDLLTCPDRRTQAAG